MDNLLNLFAGQIAKLETAGETKLTMASFSDIESTGQAAAAPGEQATKKSAKPATAVPSIVVQLAALPMHIDLKQFTNPFSPDNPTGDYLESFRFRGLADPVPELSSVFQSSQYSTERSWDNLLYSTYGTTPYTTHVISDARTKFENYKLSNFGGTLDDWRPVFAKPYNWYQLAKDKSNYTPVTLDFEKGDSNESGFVVINNNKSGIKWRSFADNRMVEEMEVKGKLNAIDMKILKIDFVRPWLTYDVLQLPGLKNDDLTPGYFSTGSFENNNGIFPLLTISMLLATDISVKGTWEEEDKDFISKTKNGSLSIGPFALSMEQAPAAINNINTSLKADDNVIQIIGYISQLVPLAPK